MALDAILAGHYLRRRRDGMLGYVLHGTSRAPRPRGEMGPPTSEVIWIDELAHGDAHRESGGFERLTGEAANEALAAFEALRCPRCDGTGRADRRPSRLAIGERCSAPRCRDGRLLGVRPAFDAAAAGLPAPLPSAPEPPPGAPRRMSLKYAAACERCGRALSEGTVAWGVKRGERWVFRCAGCGGR